METILNFPVKDRWRLISGGCAPHTAVKDAGGGVIGKQSPEICFSCGRQPLPKKVDYYSLIYFQHRKVNFVGGPRKYLRLIFWGNRQTRDRQTPKAFGNHRTPSARSLALNSISAPMSNDIAANNLSSLGVDSSSGQT
jgi:hypothetical protein